MHFFHFSFLLSVLSVVGAQSAPPEPLVNGNCTPATKFYDQAIDHFGAGNSTFKQQYQVIDTYFKPGGPIIFYQGGETAKMSCLESFVLPIWAKELGALAVTLEHRFFGSSLPNNDENLVTRYKTLTLDNVLLDSVQFIKWIKSSVPGAANSTVVSTGGSYAGFVNTLLRTNYPDVFWGAFSFAAPVQNLGYENPKRGHWALWVNKVYKDLSAEAASKIENALVDFTTNIANAPDLAGISRDLNLCTPLANTTELEGLLGIFLNAINANAQCDYAAGSPILLPGMQGNSLPRSISAILNATSTISVLNATASFWNEGRTCLDKTGASGGYFINSDLPYSRMLCTYIPVSADYIPPGTILPPTPWNSSIAALQRCQQSFGPDAVAMTQDELWQRYKFSPRDLRQTKRLVMGTDGFDFASAITALDLLDVYEADREASRATVVVDGAHCEELFAPFEGMKESVRLMQTVHLNILKEWLEVV